MGINPDKIFELMIAFLLKKNGYRVGIPVGKSLVGRGGKHQIDCLAIYPFPAPFVFPTRLVAEAKLYNPNKRSNQIGIQFVRNLHSRLIDLVQTLPRDRKLRLDEKWEENITCNYQGAIFSTAGFSAEAIGFANAYAIDTVVMSPSLVNGKPVHEYVQALSRILDDCIRNKSPAYRGTSQCDPDAFQELCRKRYYSGLSSKGKIELFKLLEYIMEECNEHRKCNSNEFKEMSELLKFFSMSKLGSLDGHVIVLQFHGDSFQRLRRQVAQRFVERAEGGDPFYPPPDDDLGPNLPPPEGGPFTPVSIKPIERPESNAEKWPRGNIQLMFSWQVKEEKIQADGFFLNSIFHQLKLSKHPKKFVVPVDFGCFFYGIVL